MSWKRFFERSLRDRDFVEELRAYIDHETAENIARGMGADDARRAAHRKLGNRTALQEDIHRMNSARFVESVWNDLRYAARSLRSSPGFTAIAVMSLALGIGANTAIFQLIDAVRLRSLPVKNPQELVEVKIEGGNHGIGLNEPYGELTRPIWEEIRRSHPAFATVFAWSADRFLAGEGTDSTFVNGIEVSKEFFPALGVQPWLGRFFLPSEEQSCPSPVAVVSYAYWQSRLGGQKLDGHTTAILYGERRQIVGVVPPTFLGLAVGERFDIAVPFCRPKDALGRNLFAVTVMGRLRPGYTLAAASAQLEAQSPGIMSATEIQGYGSNTTETYRNFRLAAYPASAGVSGLRKQYTSSLWLLLAITALVLLIACANLANLMLARAGARAHEIGVRLAIGASRLRLLQQLLLESLLLAVLGTGIGIALAAVLSRVLVSCLSTADDTVALNLPMDSRVFLFASTVAALTCVIFGLFPALKASGADPASAVKTGARGMTASKERFSMQRAMIVAQIAISLILLAGALLFVQSFYRLVTFNPGMREDGIITAWFAFFNSNIPRERWMEVERELLDEVRAIPGVTNVAITTRPPLLGGSWTHGITIGKAQGTSKFTWVSSSYFETMGIPLVSGRSLTANDTSTSERVAVVNQTFVRRFLNGSNVTGQVLRTSQEPNYPATAYRIVGVVADTKYDDLRGSTPPESFAPAWQYPNQQPYTSMMIRSSLPSAITIDSIRNNFRAKHPQIIVECKPFKEQIQSSFKRERLMALLSGLFGCLAAVLALVGLYGVISFLVTRRQNEFGIRIALGANFSQVISLVMREGLIFIGLGIPLGIVVFLIAGRGASSLLFELKPYDPATLLFAAGSLGVIGILASFVPAYRASKVDPVNTLRCD